MPAGATLNRRHADEVDAPRALTVAPKLRVYRAVAGTAAALEVDETAARAAKRDAALRVAAGNIAGTISWDGRVVVSVSFNGDLRVMWC